MTRFAACVMVIVGSLILSAALLLAFHVDAGQTWASVLVVLVMSLIGARFFLIGLNVLEG